MLNPLNMHVSSYISNYVSLTLYLNRHEIITSTWLENPDERPTFAAIVQKLSSNFTIIYELEDTIKDTEDTVESNGYISLLPNVNS